MRKPTEIRLNAEEREKLESWLRAGKTEHRLAKRAQIVLAADEGQATQAIAVDLKIQPHQVSKWRRRFAERRLDGLFDRPRSGKPARYDEQTEKRIFAVLDQKPPAGFSRWNGHLVSRHLGDVHVRCGGFSNVTTFTWLGVGNGV